MTHKDTQSTKEGKKVMSEALTWDDLAELYADRTGGRARTLPMDAVFNWAKEQPDIELQEDGTLKLLEQS